LRPRAVVTRLFGQQILLRRSVPLAQALL
jgi:hypothetical protein